MAQKPVVLPHQRHQVIDDNGQFTQVWYAFFNQLVNVKLGGAGAIPSESLSPGAIFNLTNDATVTSTDVDATNTTVNVYGSGGAGTDITVYRNGAVWFTLAAKDFTGKAYATTYYLAYDKGDAEHVAQWVISANYLEVTGDRMIFIGSVRTSDSNGVSGAASSGGGAGGDGGTGGYDSGGGGGGYGRLR